MKCISVVGLCIITCADDDPVIDTVPAALHVFNGKGSVENPYGSTTGTRTKNPFPSGTMTWPEGR
jgi:hypothetical protein